ncbi:Agbl5 [Symbiodinium microadriaticum]|nr:Agbl5 [Symbiodinium microadriaticum]
MLAWVTWVSHGIDASWVDDLRTKQVASTTTYLQELGTLRSHLRQVAAAESHLRAVAAETPTPTPSQSKRGSKTDPSSQNSQRRPSVLKKPSKNSVPADRRASFSETAEEIAIPQKMGRQPTATDGEPPKTSLSGSASGGPHGRKGRKFSTMTGAATAAMAFARAQGFGSNAPSEHDVAEVGIEFAEVHHYMWDAAEFLDQATQTLVCKVITEKLRCFKTQKEATTIAELAHLCRRMESYLKGTALEDHEKELKEVRMKLYAREEEASSLVERLQVETAQYEQKERSYIGKLQQQERLRDSLQRELVDTQAQLAAMTAKSQELANELTVYKDAEASMKKQSAAFAKSRGRILNVQKISEDGSESSLEDFFARMLPDLVQHLTKEMKDQSLKNQFTPIVKSLHQIWKSSRAKSQKTAAALEDAEREAAESSKKLEELEGARQKEKDAADAKVQSMKDRAEHAEKNLVELQSNFMDNLRQAPAYVSLREDYEICRCELEQTIKQLRAVQEEYEEKFAEHEAGWAKQAEDHRAQVQKLQNDLREVVESQLHPAQVAQLRADLKRAQHESQALTNTNNMLKDSLAALQKKQRQRLVVGPMVFTSDFDSGNMGHVELLEDAPFVSPNGQPTASQLEYAIDVAPDCAGYKTWFFFGISVAEPVEFFISPFSSVMPVELAAAQRLPSSEASQRLSPEARSRDLTPSSDSAAGEDPTEIREMDGAFQSEASRAQERATTLPQVAEGEISMFLNVRNMNNQSKLYNEGYRPWCKAPGSTWKRLQDSSLLAFSHAKQADGFSIRWHHYSRRGAGTTYYAFCAPYSYLDCQGLLAELEESFAETFTDPYRPLRNISRSLAETYQPRAGFGIYLRRQLLHRSLQGRRVDLLTVTASPGPGMDEVDMPPPDLPCPQSDLPLKFPDRPIVFLSARVHPGETPGQFVFLGALRFLLSDDPRAAKLRDRFVFKLVPILNPDGVACGHYRTNSLGLNLNRHYDKPTPKEHEGIWATKRILSHWARQNRLLVYLDLHGHASKRGCFLLANRLVGPGQGWNAGFARLCQINSPYFDLELCDFGEADDAEKEGKDGMSKEGSGRVAVYRDCKVCNAYTLECNYNTGRFTKPMLPLRGARWLEESPGCSATSEEPVPFTQSSWGQVGEAVCISILDLYGHNCHSRVPSTRQASLRALLGQTIRPRTGRTTRLKDILPNGVGLSLEDVAARERPCRGACGWHGVPEKPGPQDAKEKERSRVQKEPRPRPVSKGGRKPESEPRPSSKSSVRVQPGSQTELPDRSEPSERRKASKDRPDLASEPKSSLPMNAPRGTEGPLPDRLERRKASKDRPGAMVTSEPNCSAPTANGKCSAPTANMESLETKRSRSLDLRRQLAVHKVERLPLALLRSETPDADAKGKEGRPGNQVKEGRAIPRNAMQLVRPQRKRTNSLDASRIPKADFSAKVRGRAEYGTTQSVNLLMEAESERRRSAATGIKEEVRLLRDTCSRTVFSRLYEDAVRRSDVDQSDDAPPHARSWAGSILELRSRPHSANNAAATPRPLSAQSASTPRRALSEPPVRIVSPTALHEMQRQNAMHLQ